MRQAFDNARTRTETTTTMDRTLHRLATPKLSSLSWSSSSSVVAIFAVDVVVIAVVGVVVICVDVVAVVVVVCVEAFGISYFNLW